MNIKLKIGLRIKELREKVRMSQKDLAYAAGIDRSHIASIENGQRNVSIVNIEKIAIALNVNVKDFLKILFLRTLQQIKSDIDTRVAVAAWNPLTLPESLEIIKVSIEDVIRSGGAAGKTSLITSQQVVNRIRRYNPKESTASLVQSASY